jgi:hypothetical protein
VVLKDRLAGFARNKLRWFHNYPLNITHLYRNFHTKRFIEKAVNENALLLWDYYDYLDYNAKTFNAYVRKTDVVRDRVVGLEFGVFDGHSINILSKLMPDYRFFGFDSFEGFASVKSSSFWSSYQKRFQGQTMPTVNANVELVKGFLEETFEPFLNSGLGDADVYFVHLDMDIYEPTKIVLDWIVKSDKKFFVMFDELINYEEFHAHEYRAFLETIIAEETPYRILSLCDRGADEYGALGKVFLEVR